MRSKMKRMLFHLAHNRAVRATALTLTVVGLTIYGPAELTRFIRLFYSLYHFSQVLAEVWVMWLLYCVGIVLVWAIAWGKVK